MIASQSTYYRDVNLRKWYKDAMHRKYLLLPLILLANHLAAGENDQASTVKAELVNTKHEYNLEKLFKKLPLEIGLCIVSFSVRPLNRETTFEEFVIRRYRVCQWMPLNTELVPASKSVLGEYTWLSEMSGSRRKREIKPHESVTKRLVIKHCYEDRF